MHWLGRLVVEETKVHPGLYRSSIWSWQSRKSCAVDGQVHSWKLRGVVISHSSAFSASRRLMSILPRTVKLKSFDSWSCIYCINIVTFLESRRDTSMETLWIDRCIGSNNSSFVILTGVSTVTTRGPLHRVAEAIKKGWRHSPKSVVI
jgi:hypothetical protein